MLVAALPDLHHRPQLRPGRGLQDDWPWDPWDPSDPDGDGDICDMMAMRAEDGALNKRCVRLKGRLHVT